MSPKKILTIGGKSMMPSKPPKKTLKEKLAEKKKKINAMIESSVAEKHKALNALVVKVITGISTSGSYKRLEDILEYVINVISNMPLDIDRNLVRDMICSIEKDFRDRSQECIQNYINDKKRLPSLEEVIKSVYVTYPIERKKAIVIDLLNQKKKEIVIHELNVHVDEFLQENGYLPSLEYLTAKVSVKCQTEQVRSVLEQKRLSVTKEISRNVGRIIETVPEDLKVEMAEKIRRLLQVVVDRVTYEDIIRFYLDVVKDMTGPVKVLDIANSGMQKSISSLLGSAEGIDVSVETIVLGVVWGAMMGSLVGKTVLEEDSEVLSLISAISVAMIVVSLQITHKECPYWNVIQMIYKGYTMTGDLVKKNPTCYSFLFPRLKINVKLFPDWHEELGRHVGDNKLVIGQAINMAYTFRIADIFVVALQGDNRFGSEVRKRLLSSLSPIPVEGDVRRIISLYTEEYIYKR
jgi:hypothetical protein